MLRGPQRVEAELVHELGDVARGEEGLAQPLVGIEPLVGRRAVEPDIVELDLPDIEDVEFLDHVFLPCPLFRNGLGGRVKNIRTGFRSRAAKRG